MKTPLPVSLLVSCAVLWGCATLMNGRTQAVNIRTDLPGAICDVEP